MTVYNELNKIAYIGNTSQTLYPIPFEYINTEDIKVSIYTSKNEFVEDWRYSTQYVIEGGNVKVLSGYAIDKNKKLLILRRVDLVQDNKYREGGDFPAKSTETSFDKLTMITQQLQETLDRCVKVEVLDIQSPEQLLADVYSKLDSATEVAEQAIGAANQATTAAKDAKDAVVVAQQQITETQAFIEQARADINKTVEDSIEYVEQEAVKAATEVVGSVVGQYTDRAEAAAVSAEADANSAATSAASASANAIKAETNADEVAVYNFKNKITNCITEIPQDIKLELNNGTLTLKAGSKVYVPNGAGKFDVVNVTSDLSRTTFAGGAGSKLMFALVANGRFTSLSAADISICTSGTTAPATGIFYNTNTNYINNFSNSSVADQRSFPIAVVKQEANGTITSIDQVFNGFGYIGNAVFALPGVKGLIPNGWNEDGSLKNIEFKISNVATRTLGYNAGVLFTSASGFLGERARYYEVDNYSDMIAKNIGGLYYVKADNICYSWSGSSNYAPSKTYTPVVFTEASSSGVITSFTPKLPFRAVDQNDFNKLDEETAKLAGDNSFTGTNRFKVTYFTQAVNVPLDVDNGEKPSATQGWNMRTLNNANKTLSAFESYVETNGSTQTIISSRCYDSAGNAVSTVPFRVYANADGSGVIQGITPAAGDKSTKIATTAWVNSRECTTKATTTSSASSTKPAVVVTNYVNGTTWYRIWSDGWKEQGGEFTFTADENTITLPKAFSNTNYNIQVTQRCNNNATWDNNVRVKSKSSASAFIVRGEVNTNASNGFYWYACGY
jgi:hypothetical protein